VTEETAYLGRICGGEDCPRRGIRRRGGGATWFSPALDRALDNKCCTEAIVLERIKNRLYDSSQCRLQPPGSTMRSKLAMALTKNFARLGRISISSGPSARVRIQRQMIAAWRSCGPAPAEGFVTPRRHQGAVSKHAGTAPKNPWPSVPAGLATTRSNLDH
jgi:hypothetical protein